MPSICICHMHCLQMFLNWWPVIIALRNRCNRAAGGNSLSSIQAAGGKHCRVAGGNAASSDGCSRAAGGDAARATGAAEPQAAMLHRATDATELQAAMLHRATSAAKLQAEMLPELQAVLLPERPVQPSCRRPCCTERLPRLLSSLIKFIRHYEILSSSFIQMFTLH